ncbi:MAG: dTDP-4-dehydrorhamnose reductase [Flavobacteriaceae bacterium]|nr:dTDP-4-dehydrorhamnose reductase [Flavobacteriaceae bacterium]
MRKILITGSNGQLARCIADAAVRFPQFAFTFLDKSELDITDAAAVGAYFRGNSYYACINTAAYTNVEKAESEPERAYAVNAEGVRNLAVNCAEYDVLLLHVSTDYVFDGRKKVSYVETDATNPLNVYGASKLKGEKYVTESGARHYIVRTSWLYSQYGHNFYNTIVKHASAGRDLTITTEQTGTPTNANDLAQALLQIVQDESADYGVYHFSNEGSATWYDFANAILDAHPQFKEVTLAKTSHYPTFAARPKNSVLETDKIKRPFKIAPLNWEESLRMLINSTYGKE